MPDAQHRYGRCEVIASVRLRGDQPSKVQGVTAVVARTGQAHIALQLGRVLVYLEDRTALDALTRAVAKAQALADAVYGPADDGFTRAEARARREFEKGQRTRP